MADVFLSYKKEDRALAEQVVQALTVAGYSVWWDNDLTPRTSWDAEIEKEIASAKAVLVLWTPKAVAESSFVRVEANYAKDNHKLVPAWLQKCTLPLAFSMIQTADLSGWDRRSQNHHEWRKALLWIEALAGPPRKPAATHTTPSGFVPPSPAKESIARAEEGKKSGAIKVFELIAGFWTLGVLIFLLARFPENYSDAGGGLWALVRTVLVTMAAWAIIGAGPTIAIAWVLDKLGVAWARDIRRDMGW